MDRDQFIITVYCLVCEHYAALRARVRLRHGGFAPALTDEEVITIEICGEYFKCGTDKDIFAYFVAHYQAFFPRLHDRSLWPLCGQGAGLLRLQAGLAHGALGHDHRLSPLAGPSTRHPTA